MTPYSVTVDTAAGLLGIKRTKFYELVASGHIDTFKIGRRTLVKVDSLRRLVDAGGAL